MRSEKGDGGTLTAIVLIIFVFVGFYLIIDTGKTANFDSNFASGKYQIDSNVLGLGETGHPAQANYEFIPPSDSLVDSPRLVSVSGCVGVQLRFNATRVNFATKFSEPGLITIQMPPQTGGYINICTPPGSKIDVVFWYSK